MSSITLNGDISGSAIITVPSVAGSPTLTLPTVSGTILTTGTTQANLPANIAGNGPSFSAYFNGSLTMTSAYTYYKMTCETEQWDTNSNYDNSTNYRFTPTVAGYYQVNGGVSITSTNTAASALYKNGSLYCVGNPATNASLGRIPSTISIIVYMNGTTDYVELWGQSPSAGQVIAAYSIDSKLSTYFNAALIRGA